MTTIDRALTTYNNHERDWQNAKHGTMESEDALYGMVESLADVVAHQQRQIAALIAHIGRPLEVSV